MNMSLMSVTPEVFQLEMSALKCCKFEKSPFMLEMAETSQSAMGPCSAMAEAASLLKAWTAVSREAVLVKVPGGDASGDGGKCTDSGGSSMMRRAASASRAGLG